MERLAWERGEGLPLLNNKLKKIGSNTLASVISNDTVTLLAINNSVPKDMYNSEIKGKTNYTLQDTFMGFHCGNTCSRIV